MSLFFALDDLLVRVPVIFLAHFAYGECKKLTFCDLLGLSEGFVASRKNSLLAFLAKNEKNCVVWPFQEFGCCDLAVDNSVFGQCGFFSHRRAP